MRATALVTGANGFLGNNLVRELLADGYKVITLIRKKSDDAILKRLSCEIIRVDSYAYENIESVVSKSDYVIHCASKTDQWDLNYQNYYQANVESTKALLKACKKHDINKFVLVSTTNCFTAGNLSNPGTENSEFMPFFQHSGYAFSKYEAQKYVLKEIEDHQFPAVIIAPSFMLGAYDTKPSSGALAEYVFKKKVLFYPTKAGKSFVSVLNVCGAIINALKSDISGEAYIASGVNMTLKDYFKNVASLLGEKRILIPIPAKFTLFLLALFRSIFRHKKLYRIEVNLKGFFIENYFSNAKAKMDLMMEDTDMEKEIKATIQWLTEDRYKI